METLVLKVIDRRQRLQELQFKQRQIKRVHQNNKQVLTVLQLKFDRIVMLLAY